MDEYTIFYLVFSCVAILLLFGFIRAILLSHEKKRTKRIKELDEISSVDTSTPVKNHLKKTKRIAVKSIRERFTIFRRGLLLIFILILVNILAFPFMGKMPKTVISIMVAAAAVIIGTAARPFIENFIAGVVISFSPRFRLGDTLLIENQYGTIEDISLTHTVIKLWDWRHLIIPNSAMLNREFINYCVNNTYIFAYVEFFVGSDADIEQVKDLAIHAAKQCSSSLKKESPQFWVMGMEKDGIKCWVATWADSPASAWETRINIRTAIIIGLQKYGIKTSLYTLKSEDSISGSGLKG